MMLSPDVLSLLGNSVGMGGFYFLTIPLATGFIYISTTFSYGICGVNHPGPGSEIRCIEDVFGSNAAIVLPICSRILFTIFGSAGILVTAGFAFNEIFVYWFPNFSFAFFLLGLLMTVNLFGYRFSITLQILFVSISLLGLVFLSVFGLIGAEAYPENMYRIAPVFHFRIGLLGLLLLLGFDLCVFTNDNHSGFSSHLVKPMITGIIIACLVYCLWGAASLIHVPPEKLAATSIPYTIAARQIWGQNGRILIGLVVLTGTCSAVNALFISVTRMTRTMAKIGLLPTFLLWGEQRNPIPLVFLASGIATVMGTGMTGKPGFEIYIKASLLFWLINYGAVHLAALTLKKRRGIEIQYARGKGPDLLIGIASMVVIGGTVGLIWTDTEPVSLIKYMLIVCTVITFFSFVWIHFNRNRTRITQIKTDLHR